MRTVCLIFPGGKAGFGNRVAFLRQLLFVKVSSCGQDSRTRSFYALSALSALSETGSG